MTDKSAGRRLEAAEPTAGIRATLAPSGAPPAPANDNAPPLLARAAAGALLAAVVAAAGLAFYLLG